MAGRTGFTSVREQAFDAQLEEAGFGKGKSMWTRTRGQQIHGVDLEVLKSRGQWTVSLAFHYAFVPSVWKFTPLDTEHADQLDFALRARLGSLAYGRDTWWQTDAPGEELARQLGEAARASVRILDECQIRWADPEWFLLLGEQMPYPVHADRIRPPDSCRLTKTVTSMPPSRSLRQLARHPGD